MIYGGYFSGVLNLSKVIDSLSAMRAVFSYQITSSSVSTTLE